MLYGKFFRKSSRLKDPLLNYFLTAFVISGCGSTNPKKESTEISIGFPSTYKPPAADYFVPASIDPNHKIYEPQYIDPYWLNALIMEKGLEITSNLLIQNENSFSFVFPNNEPGYLPVSVLGWAPANQNIIDASRRIFDELEQVLNIKFNESDNVNDYNVVAISQSIQTNTAGISYFPNEYYKLGSDVFIAKGFSNPFFLTSKLTNYDYEILIHEIGHALGLKHPFESDGSNTVVLEAKEDRTTHTVMSYDDYSFSFDGTFRTLDWMALTKLYGVNASYQAGDNIYEFNDTVGLFIIDGGGVDKIDCTSSTLDAFIDLRSGTHCYLGDKSNFITDGNQLTISHGSEIENVNTGSGNDMIVGNDLDNIISTATGNDIIFAGNGIDIVSPGLGEDIIDLSEDTQAQDIITIELYNTGENSKLFYGFKQGMNGDVIQLESLRIPALNLLPLVDTSQVPSGYINNCLVRIFGDNLNNINTLKSNLSEGGLLQNFKLSESESAILISSNSQNTGETQNLYTLTNRAEHIEIIKVGQFLGNYLDIDSWALDNFIV